MFSAYLLNDFLNNIIRQFHVGFHQYGNHHLLNLKQSTNSTTNLKRVYLGDLEVKKSIVLTSSRSMNPVCLRSYSRNATASNQQTQIIKSERHTTCIYTNQYIAVTLTIDFVINRGERMEDIECMNKLIKLNDTIFLFIK